MKASGRDDVSWWLAPAVAAVWIALHGLHARILLVHDSWTHLFPFLFSVSRDVSCRGLPQWLSKVDTGSPHVIHVISSSITHLVRLPALWAMGCWQLDLMPALYLHKVQIFVSYLLFSVGMLGLGRLVFSARASAIYLFTATLFAGLCLDSSHSDQVVSILFWAPWAAMCMVLYRRNRGTRRGAWYLAATVLLASVQALDHYPHLVFLAMLTAGGVYLALEGRVAIATLLADARRTTPALLIVAALVVVAFQLLAVKAAIVAYRPSFRAELVVDPRTFGETGFAQPVELIGSVLPLGMLAAHDALADGVRAWRASSPGAGVGLVAFMYRYDVLFFHLGIVPIFCVVVALSTGRRRVHVGWAAFVTVMLLVALQASRLYFVLNLLPFFNVFRSYGLYLCFVVFGLLVLSGFGFDALITAAAEERRRLVRAAVTVMSVGGLVAIGLLLGLVLVAPGASRWWRTAGGYLVGDLVILGVSVWAMRRLSWPGMTPARTVTILVLLVVSQTLYGVGVYRILGTPVKSMIRHTGLQPEDRRPMPNPMEADEFVRRPCTTFAQCYLSLRPSASLRLDLEGSFLRSRDSVIYQPGIGRAAVTALLGVTHPVYWASRELRGYREPAEVVRALNAADRRVDELLGRVTFVRDEAPSAASEAPEASPPRLERVARAPDRVRIEYRSGEPFYLNAAVTYDRGWRAVVDGQPVQVRRGNFDGLVSRMPAGHHVAEFQYSSWSSRLFFYSRFVQLAVAVIVIWLTVRGAATDATLRGSRPCLEAPQ